MKNRQKKTRLSHAHLSQVRIISGLILFVYVLLHLLNHALGLVSIDLMEQVGSAFKTFLRFWPMTLIFYGAFLAHFIGALLKTYNRGNLRMPAADWVQLLLGIAIPLLLLVHIMGTRFSVERYGISDSYTYVLLSTVVFSPIYGWLNAFGLLAAWFHGCIGLFMWARLQNWYRQKFMGIGLICSALIPTFALAGYLAGGRQVAPSASDDVFMDAYRESLNTPDGFYQSLESDVQTARHVILFIICFVVVAYAIKQLLYWRQSRIVVEYVDGPTINQPVGVTLLDMSRNNDVPHASICGGRGRCSTCRVRVISALDDLPPADAAERKLLHRIHAGDDVRLACQLKPEKSIKVARLLPWDATMTTARQTENAASGRERIITVMFVDIRDFTTTSEARLPFDVVYLINQFSQSMGREVDAHQGRFDKFLGDGFMALFGLNSTAQQGARDAISAAGSMITALELLNGRLAEDLNNPLRIGIGIHTGPAIVGEMGYGTARHLTAIGDTVNSASRLEATTKSENCVLCVSNDTIATAELSAPSSRKREISLRGKKDKINIYSLDNTAGLMHKNHEGS